MLEGDVLLKMAAPLFRKHLEGLLHGDGAGRIKQKPLKACPRNATREINQPIEISRGPTTGELLTPPRQKFSAGQDFGVCQGRRLRQCNPDSHSSSP